MSLTTIIQSNPEIKELMKMFTPDKKSIRTFSGKQAFSKEYELRVPYTLDSNTDAALLGYAFDYLARWMVAGQINYNKDASFKNLTAEEGVYRCEKYAQSRNKDDFHQLYKQYIKIVKQYVYHSKETIDPVIIKTAIIFAKLERVVRSNRTPFDITIDELTKPETAIENELSGLSATFHKCFIEDGIIKEDSVVVFNPRFGIASYLVGGADADIYIDGTLYDFKTTIKNGYAWSQFAQVLGYGFLSSLAKCYHDSDNMLDSCEVNRIALYKARYGEIEYFDFPEWSMEGPGRRLEYFLDMKYDDFLREIKAQEEQEQKRIVEIAEKEKERLDTSLPQLNHMKAFCKQYQLSYDTYYDNVDETKYFSVESAVSSMKTMEVPWNLDPQKLESKIMSSGMSKTGFSKEIGISYSSLKSWLSGEKKPRLAAYMKLFEYFNCDVDDLCVGDVGFKKHVYHPIDKSNLINIPPRKPTKKKRKRGKN